MTDRSDGADPVGLDLPDVRELECFLKVAEHLHFGRAAEDLFLSQPTVSEAVRRLERKVGGSLFDRSTRRVALTPLGAAFVDDARAALQGLHRSFTRVRSFAQQQALTLDVGYSGGPDTQLLGVVAELQKRMPGVLVSLRVLTTPRLVRAVRDGRLHAAIGWTPEPHRELCYRPIGSTALVAVLPARHEWAERSSVSPDEIATEPLIGWPRSVNPVSFDRFAAAMDRTGAPWTLVGTTTGSDNVAARVLSGFGVAIGFEALLDVIPMPGLAYVPIAAESLTVERVLFWRADADHPALTPFTDLVTQRMGA